MTSENQPTIVEYLLLTALLCVVIFLIFLVSAGGVGQ